MNINMFVHVHILCKYMYTYCASTCTRTVQVHVYGRWASLRRSMYIVRDLETRQ